MVSFLLPQFLLRPDLKFKSISVADGAWHSLSIKLRGGRLDIELDLITVLWLEGTLVRKIGLKMTAFRLSAVGCYRSTTVDR
ncbi:Neurexin Like receptor [Ditylenchus destructor]|uniref:Neurexin Like receptor n=1 Tax=Ditylenchus destructor TaxID=166010 RepID=A0AAD4MV64_9BILA|nr:Neurexin Like receptor [Ditylenchus destructor]